MFDTGHLMHSTCATETWFVERFKDVRYGCDCFDVPITAFPRSGFAMWNQRLPRCRAGFFSLLAQRKETKRKGSPSSRPALRAGFAALAGFYEGTSLSLRKTRGVLPRALRALSAIAAAPMGRQINGSYCRPSYILALMIVGRSMAVSGGAADQWSADAIFHSKNSRNACA